VTSKTTKERGRYLNNKKKGLKKDRRKKKTVGRWDGGQGFLGRILGGTGCMVRGPFSPCWKKKKGSIGIKE